MSEFKLDPESIKKYGKAWREHFINGPPEMTDEEIKRYIFPGYGVDKIQTKDEPLGDKTKNIQ